MAQRIEQKGAKIELGYWAIRGLAQPIRLLLAFVEVPFSETRFGLNPDGTPVADEMTDWYDVRGTLNVPFPNLPYLIDARGKPEVRVTQSNSVIRYLARSFKLYGDTESERVTIDILQDEAYDLRNQIVKTAYAPQAEFEKALADFTANAVPRYLDGFERYLTSRGISSHFVGSRISHVDFILYELVWQTSVMVPGSVTRTHRPRLHAFIEAFPKIPPIAAHMALSTYIERPINSESASFK